MLHSTWNSLRMVEMFVSLAKLVKTSSCVNKRRENHQSNFKTLNQHSLVKTLITTTLSIFVHLEDFDLRWIRGANIKILQIRLKHSLKDKNTLKHQSVHLNWIPSEYFFFFYTDRIVLFYYCMPLKLLKQNPLKDKPLNVQKAEP